MSLVFNNPPAVHPPTGQYSHSVLVPAGYDIVHVAGQVGAFADGTLAADFPGQVEQGFRNLFAALAALDMAPADLVRLNYFLTPGADIVAFRRVRAGFLPASPPASTTIVVAALLDPNWLFEIDAVAARPQRSVK